MPQLDPTWIISQIFWALICFGLMFLLMRTLIIPKITTIMDDRENQIEADIKIAKNLKQELEEAINAYESTLEQAYVKADEILKQNTKDINDYIKNEENEFSQKMKKRTDEAKLKIESAKEKVLVDVENIASNLVGDILQKITSETFSENVILDNIKKEMKEV